MEINTQLYIPFVFAFGLCIGSFLNVCIWRIPQNKSVVFPPSACPHCNARIRWFDNIPLLSWLLLRAKCRDCRAPVSALYPAVELLTGVLFSAVFLLYGFTLLTPIYWLAIAGLILGTFIDIWHMILPDRITIGGMILFPVLSALVPALHGAENFSGGIIKSLVGLAAGFGLFWIVRITGGAVLKKEALGLGDVKLMGAVGALLGWQAVLYVTFISAFTGALIGLILIALRRRDLQSRIPYGPYISAAAVTWFLGGFRLWEFYLSLLG